VLDLSDHGKRWSNSRPRSATLDILINNAGDIPAGSVEILDDAAWRRGFDLKCVRLHHPVASLLSADEGQGRRHPHIIGNSGENWDASYIAGSTG